MTDQELKEWFWNKFNSCYYVKHDDYPESLFMYYDVNFIRKAKFKILQGEEIVYPSKPIGICLFEHDYKNGWLMCSYKHIWSFFESNSCYNYIEIRDLIKGWLEEDTKLKVLTPLNVDYPFNLTLEEDTKLKVLTPGTTSTSYYPIVGRRYKIKGINTTVEQMSDPDSVGRRYKIKGINTKGFCFSFFVRVKRRY